MNEKTIIAVVCAIMAVIMAVVFSLFWFANVSDDGGNSKGGEKLQKNGVTDKANKDANEEAQQDIPASEPVISEPQVSKVSFVAAGDNLIHSTVYTDAQNLAQGTDKLYNFVPMYENVSDIISGADLAYINQEAPIAGKELGYSGYPMFNSPDEVGYDLKEVGFDIVNIANNHMLDRYEEGYANTIDFFKNLQGVTYIGGYENEEDYNNIRIIEKNGISIAFLAYTYGTNGVNLPAASQMVIPLCDDEGTAEIDRQTKLARTLADVVIVSVHWGYEDNFTPNSLQQEQMLVMAENGVDVIIGTHPHVLQPMFWQERQDGGKTLVIYSLGNFLSGMLYARNMVGGIAGFDIVKTDDEVSVENVYFIPTVCHYDSQRQKFKIHRFSQYTEQMFATHGTQLVSDPGRSLDYMRKIIDDAISPEFLTEDFYSEVNTQHDF